MVMGYIVKGIEKNAECIKEYILDVDDLRRNNRSLEEAKLMFQKHDSRIQVLRIFLLIHSRGNNMNISKQVYAKQDIPTGLTCKNRCFD